MDRFWRRLTSLWLDTSKVSIHFIFQYPNVLSQHAHFLLGDENSKVQGILENDGTFDGVIITGNGEEFFVEPSKR